MALPLHIEEIDAAAANNNNNRSASNSVGSQSHSNSNNVASSSSSSSASALSRPSAAVSHEVGTFSIGDVVDSASDEEEAEEELDLDEALDM